MPPMTTDFSRLCQLLDSLLCVAGLGLAVLLAILVVLILLLEKVAPRGGGE